MEIKRKVRKKESAEVLNQNEGDSVSVSCHAEYLNSELVNSD